MRLTLMCLLPTQGRMFSVCVPLITAGLGALNALLSQLATSSLSKC